MLYCNAYKCFASVSDICCKYFSCFQIHVASVSFGCCKSRSGVAHVTMGPTAAATCYSHWVTSGRYGPAAGTLPSRRKWACEKPSTSVRAMRWGTQKTDGAGSSPTPQRRYYKIQALASTLLQMLSLLHSIRA
jgi:hypothetical protein